MLTLIEPTEAATMYLTDDQRDVTRRTPFPRDDRRIERVRRAIADGSYVNGLKLDVAIDRLLDAVLEPRTGARLSTND